MSDVEIDAGAVAARFVRDGFAVIERLASAECVETLRHACEDPIDGRIATGARDRRLGGLTRQIMIPHSLHPAFAENEALRNGRRRRSRT